MRGTLQKGFHGVVKDAFYTQAVLAEDLKKGTSRSLLYHLPEKFFSIYFKYFLFYELNMTR